jgi:copper chaperone CopZ
MTPSFFNLAEWVISSWWVLETPIVLSFKIVPSFHTKHQSKPMSSPESQGTQFTMDTSSTPESHKMTMSQKDSDITTSFLLSNLHCPSCVSHIQDILSALQPPPSSISPWLASSWVIVKHDKALPVKDIQQALEEGGFDVCDVSPEDIVNHSSGETGYLDRFIDKWSNNHEAKPRQNKHLDNCDLCRLEVLGKDGMSSSSKPQDPPITMDDKDLVSVVVDAGEEDVWQATLAVGGMTCAACVVTITEELGKKNWIKNVVVNLIGNSATVDFVGQQHKDDLIESFDNIGYDATIDSIVNLHAKKDAVPTISRTVEIKIDGMFCDHCPPRILTAFETFGDRIKVEKPLTLQDPIMKITYTPQVPSFTIRNIIASISSVDEALIPTIYHPPTLEERSRKIHTRERKRIFMRVILTLIIAIPTFVIGIVLMSLVSSNNSARRYFHTPSGWRVSRAQWALFALATPVWFLCADVFHIRAMKEVRALWRPGSTTPFLRRFYRFGSMNMLMSLGTSIAYLSSVAQLIAAGAR